MAQGPQIRLSRKVRGFFRGLGLRKYGIGVLTKTDQGFFVVDPKDFGVGRSLLDRGSYDAEVIKFLLNKIDANSTVVFVGAHIGAILIPIAKKAARVIAFEPNPATHEMLEANVKLNCLSNVILYKFAASSKKELVKMQHNSINTGGSSVSTSQDSSGESVEAMPLDDLIGEEKIDLMVVDAEGFEAHVFAGAEKTLSNTTVLYTEYSPTMLVRQGTSPDRFFDALKKHFQSMCIGTNESPKYSQSDWQNTLNNNNMAHKPSFLLNLTFF